MKETFITSLLTFYMKASISLEGDFIKTSSPNSILKLIPLGSKNKTVPIEQISSVDDSFRLDIKSFIWGLFMSILGISLFSDKNTSFILALIILLYGISTLLSSLETKLILSLSSGGEHIVSMIFFEKSKALNVKEKIEKLISARYSDTNVKKHSDRIIDAIKSE